MDNFSAEKFSTAFLETTTLREDFSVANTLEYSAAVAGYPAARTVVADERIPLEIPVNAIIKRFVDIVFAVLFIVLVLSWLLPIIAILIKLDSKGPVFFFQKRNRIMGTVFWCIKFRSMVVNDNADIIAAAEDDDRITRVGRFLRHHHLDELPQLFNVLKGDMSLVGPRPHMISENIFYEELLKGYAYRHKVKPGITGLAQSMGKFGATADLAKVEERVELDIRYIKQWSVKMDCMIIMRTCRLICGIK